MKIRCALVAAPLALAAVATSSLAAAPKAPPQIVDPKGDSAGGQASLDVLSVQYSTSGTGAGKSYVPKKLIVALTLAGAPRSDGLVSYNLAADTDGCGMIDIHFAPGTVTGGLVGDTWADFGSCAEGYYMPSKIKGSVVTFEFALKAIGMDRGTEFSAFAVTVDPSEPATGIFGTDMVGAAAGLGDKGTGDGTWVIP